MRTLIFVLLIVALVEAGLSCQTLRRDVADMGEGYPYAESGPAYQRDIEVP